MRGTLDLNESLEAARDVLACYDRGGFNPAGCDYCLPHEIGPNLQFLSSRLLDVP